MKDLKTINRGITHCGKFHTDDVISTAFLKVFNPNIQIERVLEYEGEPEDDEIVFDIGLGEFDHHQEDRLIDDNGHAYCAFGLLWESYGRQYLENKGFKNIDNAFARFKKYYVSKINQGDNEGYKFVKKFYENDLIMKCNPMWFEDADEEVVNKQFEKAVKIGSAFLDSWTRRVFNEVEEHNIFIG